MSASTKTITISNHSDILLHDVEQSIAALQTSDLERFILNIRQLAAARTVPHLDKKETKLLKAINNSIPSEQLERYKDLLEKIQEGTLTSIENEEFLSLNEKIEQLNVNRMKSIIALARLRNVTVPSLMAQLNLYTNGID
jgi:hypothetical protein